MSEFKNILALDSAMAGVSAGIYSGGKRFARSEVMAGGQAERLMPIIQDVMAEAGLKFPDIDTIVTTVGPGAFTGLRIGLSAAKSLGLALNRKVHGITTLQALAAQYAFEKEPKSDMAVIIETKREDFYFQVFSKDAAAVSIAAALPVPEIINILKEKDFVVLGDGVARFKASAHGVKNVSFEGGYTLPDAGFMAFNFHENAQKKEGIYTGSPDPVYLRGADVTSPKTPGRPAISSH